MEREIKFEVCIRRKDGSDLYKEVLTIDQLIDRNGCYYSPSIQEVVYRRQYTGLKDKNGKDENGKEIYDKDIIEFTEFYNAGGIGGFIEGDRQHIGLVEYDTDMLCWMVKVSEEITFYLANVHLADPTLKIIGNKYENPELLNS